MGKSDRAGKWVTSDPHTSNTMDGKTHFDVEKFDDSGNKDRDAGKVHISGEPHNPSMTDIHKP